MKDATQAGAGARDGDGLGAAIASLPWLEALYDRWLKEPATVPPAWRRAFERLGGDPAGALRGPTWQARNGASRAGRARTAGVPRGRALQHAADHLVRAYRVRGHRRARVDPLDRPLPDLPELDPAWHGLSAADMDSAVVAQHVPGPGPHRLGDLIEHLEATYCGSLGVQFMHIDEEDVRDWLIHRMESVRNRARLSREEQIHVLDRLVHAATFEAFMQKKYLGAKTFSLEGGETLIPLLDMAIERAAEQGVEEVVLAMSHRGRLNVLANVVGKEPWRIFREFEDAGHEDWRGSGDVKYHLGYHCECRTSSGRAVRLSLCFNPSHLEFVTPVLLGRVRGRQDAAGDTRRRRVLGIAIHGDAAFAGEGVVQEALNLGRLEAYGTGGTIHVVVNNQIGFTTEPAEGRSSTYATDVARMLPIPIFHVNGEDPEAVAQAVRLAVDFRERFQRDVVLDMYCYRRRGHNEGDEPRFTQPLMVARIRNRDPVAQRYLRHLLETGEIQEEDHEAIQARCRAKLDEHLERARADEGRLPLPESMGGLWRAYYGGPERYQDEVETALPEAELRETLLRAVAVPAGFTVLDKLERVLEHRRAAARGEQPVDWATAEGLAFASLARQGVPLRVTGQDTERGTFSQRHAVWHDAETGARYEPFQALGAGQAPVEIRNSPLSEAGALGFEYGYSADRPDVLVVWEAQFGDFVNAAQVIVDQFIASAEDKWRRRSGLVLLLPHGYEGQGPEHSSARPERFLALAAEDNLQVAQPTTAAQYFHLLRRQALRRWRKPLVVLTPKSLLRRREAASPLADLAAGAWRRILPDPGVAPGDVERVLLCTGKVVYDLLERREDRRDVAVIRLEQIYPLPDAFLEEALDPYGRDVPVRWVQEEPANMGAWPWLRQRFGDRLCGRPFEGVSRRASASPATGSHGAHDKEQADLLDAAFAANAVRKHV